MFSDYKFLFILLAGVFSPISLLTLLRENLCVQTQTGTPKVVEEAHYKLAGSGKQTVRQTQVKIGRPALPKRCRALSVMVNFIKPSENVRICKFNIKA